MELTFERVIAWLAQGKWELAEQDCRALLAQSPELAMAAHVLGGLLAQRQAEEAGVWLQRAVQLAPEQLLYRLDYIRWLAQTRRWEAAWQLCQPLLRPGLVFTPPEKAAVALLAGNLLRDLGQSTEAIVQYRQVISLQPDHLQAVLNLGELLHASGRDAAAVAVYRAALGFHSASAELLNHLGVSLQALQQFDAALQQYRQAVVLAPDFVLAWHNLARLAGQTQHLDEAREAYTTLLALQPEHQEFRLAQANLWPRLPATTDEMATGRARLHETLDLLLAADFRLDPDRTRYGELHPSPLLAYQGEADGALQQKYARLFQRALPVQAKVPLSVRKRPRQIGLVVTAHEALFLRWLGPLIPQLARQAVQVSLISRPAAMAMWPATLGSLASLQALAPDLPTAVEQLRRLDCDLLYYWESGTDSLNYFLPFFRLARVQSHGFGWPLSSAAPEMDVCFASAAAEPPDSDRHYAERLIRLAPLLTFEQPVMSRLLPAGFRTRADFALPPAARLYLCCQDVAKLQPDWDVLAAGILAQDPRGLLLLTCEDLPPLRQRLQAAGADPGRIRFFPRLAYPDFLSLLHLADVVLDSTHFSGASTSLEAFACGSPVITLPGRFQRGRYTLACYQALGLPDAVAWDGGEYVQKALALAGDPKQRQALSRQIQKALPQLFVQEQAIAALAEAMLGLLG